MKRTYLIANNIKTAEEGEERVIRGIATSSAVDRVGDIVDPAGVRSESDIPLFLYHDSHQTVGRAKLGKPTKDGIPFEARLPKIAEAGRLKDRVDEAWQMLKYRLITGVSIGFNVLNDAYESIKDGGYRFLETEVLELSLVPIPANQTAKITTIKSIVEQHLAALGHQGSPPTDRNRPGASGQSSKPPHGGFFHSRSQKGINVKTLSELRELRTTKHARMKELTDLFQQDGHDTTDEEASEFDGLADEIKQLDTDIRVAQYHATNAAGAKSVSGGNSEAGSASRGGLGFVKKTDPDDKFKGQAKTRLFIAKALSYIAMKQGEFVTPAQIAEARWGKSHPNLVRYIKTAVAGGGTGSGEWGAELVQSDARYTGDFIEYLYSKTVFDSLPLRPVPARVHIKGQDGAATGYWVGESKAINVSKIDTSTVELTPLKVAAMAVCSKELVMDSDPSAEMLIRDSIAEASAQRVDSTFFSTTAASNGVSPAGILNGVSAKFSEGPTAAELRDDVAALYADFITAKNASGLVFVTTPSLAKAISLMVNALGQTEFPGLNASGGTLLGDPVYTGDNVGTGDLILMKPSDIWKIGDSGIEMSMSDTATIEQNDAPQGASDTPTAASATLMSLWQTESVGFKVVRRINYAKRRSGAVSYIGDAAYGQGT